MGCSNKSLLGGSGRHRVAVDVECYGHHREFSLKGLGILRSVSHSLVVWVLLTRLDRVHSASMQQ